MGKHSDLGGQLVGQRQLSVVGELFVCLVRHAASTLVVLLAHTERVAPAAKHARAHQHAMRARRWKVAYAGCVANTRALTVFGLEEHREHRDAADLRDRSKAHSEVKVRGQSWSTKTTLRDGVDACWKSLKSSLDENRVA